MRGIAFQALLFLLCSVPHVLLISNAQSLGHMCEDSHESDDQCECAGDAYEWRGKGMENREWGLPWLVIRPLWYDLDQSAIVMLKQCCSSDRGCATCLNGIGPLAIHEDGAPFTPFTPSPSLCPRFALALPSPCLHTAGGRDWMILHCEVHPSRTNPSVISSHHVIQGLNPLILRGVSRHAE